MNTTDATPAADRGSGSNDLLGQAPERTDDEEAKVAELKAAALSILLGASPANGPLSVVQTKRLTVLGNALRAFSQSAEP